MNPTVGGKTLLFDLAGIEDSQLCDFLTKGEGHNIGVKYVIAWVGGQSIVVSSVHQTIIPIWP